MTQEEIIEMARWSGLGMLLEVGGMDKCLEHFAKLVAEKAIKETLAQPEQESVAMADYMALTEKYVALKAKEKNT